MKTVIIIAIVAAVALLLYFFVFKKKAGMESASAPSGGEQPGVQNRPIMTPVLAGETKPVSAPMPPPPNYRSGYATPAAAPTSNPLSLGNRLPVWPKPNLTTAARPTTVSSPVPNTWVGTPTFGPSMGPPQGKTGF